MIKKLCAKLSIFLFYEYFMKEQNSQLGETKKPQLTHLICASVAFLKL